MFLPRTIDEVTRNVRGHAHLIAFAHTCGYCSRAATISFAELHVRLLLGGAASIRISTVSIPFCKLANNVYLFFRPQVKLF